MSVTRTASWTATAVLTICIASVGAAQDSSRVARDSVTRIRPVTIVATPVDREQPNSATRVDALTIRAIPSTSPYDLLRQAAGVEVHLQAQGPGFASDASLRGFSSDHSTDLALWVDGVPINEPMNGHAEGYNDWSVLFPGGIRDVDVIHGPTNALFGNFALAGVVNVRTIERMSGTEFTATGGSYGNADAMVMTGFDHGRDGGGVLGLRFQRSTGFRPNSDEDVVQGHGRLVKNLSSTTTLDLGAELYGSNWDSPGFLSESEFAAHDYDVVSNPTDGGYKRRAQERASLRVLIHGLVWRTTAYATEGRWQLFLTIPPAGGQFEGSGSQTEEEDSRAGLGATSAATWAGDRSEVIAGVETRWDRSRYDNFFTTSRARDSVAAQLEAHQLLGAPFIQSYFNLTDRLRLDLGARLDVLGTSSTPVGDTATNATSSVFSPKAGLLFRVAAPVGIYGNVSRGFRSTDGVIEDPTLTPITEWSYETGIKLDRSGSSASLALFRMDVSNEQTFDPVTLQASNGGASRRQGVEIDWRVPMLSNQVTATGDWTFNDARYRTTTSVTEDGDVQVLNGLRVFNTSKYVGTAALELAPRSDWHIRLGGNWVGPYSPFDEPGVVLGGYGLAQASAEWHTQRGDIGFGVRNLFDRAFPELVAGHVVAPGEPRTVFVTLRVRSAK